MFGWLRGRSKTPQGHEPVIPSDETSEILQVHIDHRSVRWPAESPDHETMRKAGVDWMTEWPQ